MDNSGEKNDFLACLLTIEKADPIANFSYVEFNARKSTICASYCTNKAYSYQGLQGTTDFGSNPFGNL